MRPHPRDYPSAAAFQGACIKFNRENYRNPMHLFSEQCGSRKWWGFQVEGFEDTQFSACYPTKKDALAAHQTWLANFDKAFAT